MSAVWTTALTMVRVARGELGRFGWALAPLMLPMLTLPMNPERLKQSLPISALLLLCGGVWGSVCAASLRMRQQPGFSLLPGALWRLRVVLAGFGLLVYALAMAAGGMPVLWTPVGAWTAFCLLLVRFAAGWRWGPGLVLLLVPLLWTGAVSMYGFGTKEMPDLMALHRRTEALSRLIDPWAPLVLVLLLAASLPLRAKARLRSVRRQRARPVQLLLRLPPLARVLLRIQPGLRLMPRWLWAGVAFGGMASLLHLLAFDPPSQQETQSLGLVFLAVVFALHPWVVMRRQQRSAQASWGLARLLPGMPSFPLLQPHWRVAQWRSLLSGLTLQALMLLTLLVPFGWRAMGWGLLALALATLLLALLVAMGHPEDRPRAMEAIVPTGVALLLCTGLAELKPSLAYSLPGGALALTAAFLLFHTLHRRHLTP